MVSGRFSITAIIKGKPCWGGSAIGRGCCGAGEGADEGKGGLLMLTAIGCCAGVLSIIHAPIRPSGRR